MTRLPRSFSMRRISRFRAVSRIFCRSQGWSMEIIKKIQKRSPIPAFMEGVLLSPRPVFIGVGPPGLRFLEQGQEDHPGQEAADMGPPGHTPVGLAAHQGQRAAVYLTEEPDTEVDDSRDLDDEREDEDRYQRDDPG